VFLRLLDWLIFTRVSQDDIAFIRRVRVYDHYLTLKRKALWLWITLVAIYQSTRRHVPEGFDSSATLLREPSISRLQFYFIFFHGLLLPLSAYIFISHLLYNEFSYSEFSWVWSKDQNIYENMSEIKNRQSEYLRKKHDALCWKRKSPYTKRIRWHTWLLLRNTTPLHLYPPSIALYIHSSWIPL
jgi:hypothetical protein